MIVTVVVPPAATCVGLKLHVVSAGNPEHEKLFTLPLNPDSAFTSTVSDPDCPALPIVAEPAVSEKSGTLMTAPPP